MTTMRKDFISSVIGTLIPRRSPRPQGTTGGLFKKYSILQLIPAQASC